MEKRPRHRPKRRFDKIERKTFECELEACPHCGEPLRARRPWHMDKTVQTMKGVVRLVGKSKECVNPKCTQVGEHYFASRVWLISLPHSSYGLDVLAYIGWQHEHAHEQLVEIQRELNERGILVNERNVGNLYRQFLALLGAMQAETRRVLEATVKKHGGVIWAMDALEPEGCGSMLYVLYEVLSSTPVAALQVEHVSAAELAAWLKPYQEAGFPVLATLSDGEETIAAAFQSCWPDAPHQRCQMHFLGNLVEEVLKEDDQLRKNLRNDLGGLPAAPKQPGEKGKAPLF
jgi:Transposase, Mutator family